MARRAVQQSRPRARSIRSILAALGERLRRWRVDSAECQLDVALWRATRRDRSTCSRPQQANAPVLVFIHGWLLARARQAPTHSFIAPAFVDAGAAVVVPNYALCPAVTIETIALQLTQALA